MMVMRLAERCCQTAVTSGGYEPVDLRERLGSWVYQDGGDASPNLNEFVSATTDGCQEDDRAEI